MNLIHTVSLRDAPAEPWRNGGGVTQELLAWPRHGPWQLRVSVATIASSGPFSPYPEILRWFTVLSGAGVRLDLADGPRSLVPGDEPVSFDGEDAPNCQLLEGLTMDLNLMARRGAGVAEMRRAGAGSSIDGPLRWRGLYAAGSVLLDIEGVAQPVHSGTLVWSDASDASQWALHAATPGPAWWLTLQL